MGATKDFTTGQNTATHSTTITGLTAGLNTIYIACANPNDASRFSGNSTTTVTISATPPAPTSMQTMTTAYCNSMSTNSTLALRDTRDSHYYYVGKMADGKCWMLTNLAYGGTEAGTQFTSGAGQSTTTNQTASGTNWNATSPPYNNQKQWVNPTTSTVTQYSGTRCATAYRTSAASLDYTECGYLYNWCAALGTASANCSESTDGTIITNAGAGVCPAGWRLPTGGSSGEFQALHTAMGSSLSNWLSSGAWRGVYSGSFYGGYGLDVQGGFGYYWSATARASGYANYMYFSSTNVYLTSANYKYSGFAVRCVAN
jgi:uncharacterized protein (TIGR02145 family)